MSIIIKNRVAVELFNQALARNEHQGLKSVIKPLCWQTAPPSIKARYRRYAEILIGQEKGIHQQEAMDNLFRNAGHC